MSYYGADLDTTETSFDDPTDELEIQAGSDDPDADLGDSTADLRKRRKVHEIDPSLVRTIRGRGI